MAWETEKSQRMNAREIRMGSWGVGDGWMKRVWLQLMTEGSYLL